MRVRSAECFMRRLSALVVGKRVLEEEVDIGLELEVEECEDLDGRDFVVLEVGAVRRGLGTVGAWEVSVAGS